MTADRRAASAASVAAGCGEISGSAGDAGECCGRTATTLQQR